MPDSPERPTSRKATLPLVLQVPAAIAAGIYATAAITAAILWKPLSVMALLMIFLTPAIAAAMVGLSAILRVGPRRPLLLLYLGLLPLAAALFVGGPVTVLAWLLSAET